MSKSLAAQAGVLSKELKLPSIFSGPQDAVKARRLPPYIVFAHPKRADEWARINSLLGSVNEGEMYFIHSDYVVHMPLLKASWLCHKQFWAEANGVGVLQRSSFSEMPRPYKEHVEACVLVYFTDRVMPANVQFRSAKCPAAKTLSDALAECQTPKWAEKSSAHKETLVCQQPFARFFGEITLSPQRTSKSSGLLYRTTQCTVKPTTLVEWRLLQAFSEQSDSEKMLNDCANVFADRLKHVEQLLGK